MAPKQTASNERKNPQINAYLQIQILKLISQEEVSLNQIPQRLGRDNSYSIKKAVDVLKGRKHVKELESITWENKEPPLVITKIGLDFALEFFSPEEFWKMCFYLFDKTNSSKLKLNFSSKRFFEKYKNSILNINQENYLPSYFIRNLNEFKTISLKKPMFPYDSTSIITILDVLGWRKASTLAEIYTDLKKIYPKTYAHLTCAVCKRKYPEFHRIMHKDRDLLEDTLEMMVQDNYVQEIELKNKKNYSLLHSGLLLSLYYLFRDLDKKNIFSVNQLRDGLEGDLTKGQRGLKQRINLILENYENLLPAIFSRESRNFLGINDYYIMYILIMIYSEYEKDFLFKAKISQYHFLSGCRDIMEQKFQNSVTDYHHSGLRFLKSIIKNRKIEKNFCSEISENYFNQKEKEIKNFDKNFRKRYKKRFAKEIPKRTRQEEVDFSSRLLSDANLIIKLKEETIPKRKLSKYLNHLPTESDLPFFERVLPVLKELILIEDIYNWSEIKLDNVEDTYENEFKIIQDKITFDFLLLYSNLEEEKWKENFSKLPIKKWYSKKILRIIDYSDAQQQEILNKIKEN